MDILGGDDNSKSAVDLDDVALAERAGDDFHGFLDGGLRRWFAIRCCVCPCRKTGSRLSGTCANSGRTIPILSPTAGYFRRILIHKIMPKRRSKTPTIAPVASPFWVAHVHADRRPFLLARNRIVSALRGWFAGQDFVEVETGALQVSPGNETHLHAFATRLTAPDGTSTRLYLRTSPEFACKKLLAAGEARIVEFAKVFRNRERGTPPSGIHPRRVVPRPRAI